jgi:hypothetical protein
VFHFSTIFGLNFSNSIILWNTSLAFGGFFYLYSVFF